MKNALIVSVGGSPAPLIHSINSHKPEYLFFFASRSSAASAREQVLPALEHKPAIFEFILTSDEQNLEKCVAALLVEVPKKLDMWGLTFENLAADYTGGTKTMSAALVLALSRRIDSFSYVGGTERDKAGLGVVIDGRELMLHLNNPWNELAIQALNDIQILFNSCRYSSAAQLALETRDKTPTRRQLFEAIRITSTAFDLWDSFQYDKALNELKRCESLLRQLAAETDKLPVKQLYQAVSASLPVLQNICDEQNAIIKSSAKAAGEQTADGAAITHDLVANALRRGEVEQKFDDAVARLYSAIEKMAKIRLKIVHGIDNSSVDSQLIPEMLRMELVDGCSSGRENKIQLPLHKSFQLLEALGDPLGRAYAESADELGKILTIRNMSLLAHGFEPVKSDTYQKMAIIALRFLGIEKKALHPFPVMNWEAAY